MTRAGADDPADVPPDALRRAGERIEELLDASAAAGGRVARSVPRSWCDR